MPHARKPKHPTASSSSSARTQRKGDSVHNMQRRLFELGYVTGDRKLLADVHTLLELTTMTHGPTPAMLLQGPPGTGKTYLAQTFVPLWDAKSFFAFQFTPGVTREDLMFDLNIANIASAQAGRWDGAFTPNDAVAPGIFAQALLSSQQHKTVLLLDELDKANDKVDAFLLEYLQDCVMHAGPLGRLAGNPRNLVVFITMNDQRLITEPLMRRCYPRLELAWPQPEVEVRLVRMLAMKQLKARASSPRVNVRQLATNIVRLANEVRGFGKQLKKAPSTPELATAVVSCAVLPTKDWGHAVQSALLAYPGDRQLAHSLWGKSAEMIGKELEKPLVEAPKRPAGGGGMAA